MALFLYLKLQLDLWGALNRSSCQAFVSQAAEKGLNNIRDMLYFGRYIIMCLISHSYCMLDLINLLKHRFLYIKFLS